MNTLISIPDQDILGEGKLLYGVITVDQDDTEDSNVALWRANDEDHLYEQVKRDFCGDDEDGFLSKESFDEAWGYWILPKEIGKIK